MAGAARPRRSCTAPRSSNTSADSALRFAASTSCARRGGANAGGAGPGRRAAPPPAAGGDGRAARVVVRTRAAEERVEVGQALLILTEQEVDLGAQERYRPARVPGAQGTLDLDER